MQLEKTLPNSGASVGAPMTLRGLGRRRVLPAGLALLVIVAGLAWQWNWLVALGIAPVLIALAPCAIMCTFGLCMNKMGAKTCSSPGKGGNVASNQAPSAAPSGDVRQ